jgi:hypothetical protein
VRSADVMLDDCTSALAYIGFAVISFGCVRMLSKSHDNDPSSRDSDEALIHPKQTIQFPWEPRAHNDNEDDSRNPKESSHNQGASDFVTMMTFANQSLRQPSCPCCL